MEQGRFTSSVRANNPNRFTLPNLECYAVEDGPPSSIGMVQFTHLHDHARIVVGPRNIIFHWQPIFSKPYPMLLV